MTSAQTSTDTRHLTMEAERIATVLTMFGVFGDRDNRAAMNLSREGFVTAVISHAASTANGTPLELDYPARGARVSVVTGLQDGVLGFLSVTGNGRWQKGYPVLDYAGLNKALKKMVPPAL